MIGVALILVAFVALCWRMYMARVREERKLWLAELSVELANGFIRVTDDAEETVDGRFTRRTIKAEFGLFSDLKFECLMYADGTSDLVLHCESRYRRCRIEANDVPKDDIGTPLVRYWHKIRELTNAKKYLIIVQA